MTMNNAKTTETSTLPSSRLSAYSTTALLTELGRRFNIRFGELRAKFHESKPSLKVQIDHKVERTVE